MIILEPQAVLADFHPLRPTLHTLVQHMYITGGSSGLGLALAKYMASKGASVTIVARDQKKLDEAKLEIQVSEVSYLRPSNARYRRSLSLPVQTRCRRTSESTTRTNFL